MRSLYHYGIRGMRWGVRRTEKQFGLTNLSKSKTANLSQWGKDPSHNILYITGVSGSGKSTIARSLADANTNVIHLDSYFEKLDKNVASSVQDKEFNEFLKQNFSEHNQVSKLGDMKNESKEKRRIVDAFMDQTEKFSQQQFSKGKKVIVEGVQLADETTYPDKNFFKDKPLVIAGTNSMTSFLRATQRDEKSILLSPKSASEYMQWYSGLNKKLDALSETSEAKNGDQWVKNYIRNN